MRSLGAWRFTCDLGSTVAAYARAEAGYTQTCTCNGCRNFVVARFEAFPKRFVALLESLGIDPVKEGEIYHTCRMSPGKHLYGGWYHFVGSLEDSSEAGPQKYGDEFQVTLGKKSAPCLDALKELPLVQLEFVATAVPWCLDEPEAE